MKNIILIAGMVALLNGGVQAETLFRWIDSQGNVHYGDRPGENATNVEQKGFKDPTLTDDDLLPFESRQARQNFPVTLYVTESCGDPCVQAGEFLNKRGIPYAEKALILKEDVEAFKKLTGGGNVPALTIGKTVLNGFEAGQWDSELDIAGYPKTAPLGVHLRPIPVKERQAESVLAPVTPAE